LEKGISHEKFPETQKNRHTNVNVINLRNRGGTFWKKSLPEPLFKNFYTGKIAIVKQKSDKKSAQILFLFHRLKFFERGAGETFL